MKIKLYDSLSQTHKFLSRKDRVCVYLCGPTVYDDVHIGNIAPVLIFDFLIRYLRHKNQEYCYIHNVTDIDDKIIRKALSLGIKEEEVSSKYTDRYLEILSDLNVVFPTHMPRVSEHIKEIQDVTKRLLEKDFAGIEDGDVVLKIEKIKEYGELSQQKLSKLTNPSDFCLWKKTIEGKVWESPWGDGRPGWHTECYAFIEKYAGRVDIHGGGVDLKFPHHENENAHSRALSGKTLADIWMHIGHIHTEDGKISKSSNKRFLVKDLLRIYSPNVIRYLFLTNKYTLPTLIDKKLLDEFSRETDGFILSLNKARSLLYLNSGILEDISEGVSEEVLNALENDLHLTEVLTILHRIKKELNGGIKERNIEKIGKNYRELISNWKWLGFLFEDKHQTENLSMLKEWKKFMDDKDYEKADYIREKLIGRGII